MTALAHSFLQSSQRESHFGWKCWSSGVPSLMTTPQMKEKQISCETSFKQTDISSRTTGLVETIHCFFPVPMLQCECPLTSPTPLMQPPFPPHGTCVTWHGSSAVYFYRYIFWWSLPETILFWKHAGINCKDFRWSNKRRLRGSARPNREDIVCEQPASNETR